MSLRVRKHARLIVVFAIRYHNMEVEYLIDMLGYLVNYLFGD